MSNYQENRGEYISLSPSTELTFKFEKNKFIAELIISNLLIKSVFFKVKITEPNYYLVDPACGELLPSEQKLIKIIMLPNCKYKERYNDKFLVQAFVSERESILDRIKGSMESFESCRTELGRIQKLRLDIKFLLKGSQKPEKYNDHTPLKEIREPLKERFPTQDPSTADSQRNKNDFSDYDAMHYIPRRSKILSPEDYNQKGVKESAEKNMSQVSQGQSMNQMDSRDIINEIKFSINNAFAESKLPEPLGSDDSDQFNDIYTKSKKMYENKSFIGSSDLKSHLKNKIKHLENKYEKEKTLLAKMRLERDAYVEEINKMKFIYGGGGKFQKLPSHCLEKKSSGRFQLWQLLLTSVAFLVLGSVIFS